MALNPHFGVTPRNDALDAIDAYLGTSALFTIYAGTQPADVSSAITAANTIVASLTFPATQGFGAAASGVLTANTITGDTSAAGGSANWFSIRRSTGARVADGSIGTSGSDLNLNSQAVSTGAAVSISAFTITIAA
jgi:hypothetical protein